MKPIVNDYPEKLAGYILPIEETTLLQALEASTLFFLNTVNLFTEEKRNYAYAVNKWTVNELILHCIDTERLFCARAVMFARGETQKAVSFDENEYAKNSFANDRTLLSLIDEFDTIRASTVSFFKNLTKIQLLKTGTIPSGEITVNALGYAICGHLQHHLQILKERYY